MTLQSRRLANQLDAAIDRRAADVPGELVPLVAIAEAIRHAGPATPRSRAPVLVRVHIQPYQVSLPARGRLTSHPRRRPGRP